MGGGFLYGYPVQDVTRLIYFQFGGLTGTAVYLMPILLILFLSMFFFILHLKNKSWKKSKKNNFAVKKSELIKNIFINLIFQSRTNKVPFAAVMHSMIFIPGIVIFILEFIYFFDIYILKPLFNFRLLIGHFYLIWTFTIELSALFIIGGIILSLYRRLILRPSNLHSERSDYFFLAYISIMLILAFVKQAVFINLNNFPEFEKWSFAAFQLSHILPDSYPHALEFIYAASWFLFNIMLFSLFIIFYRTKFGHMVFAALNLAVTPQSKISGKNKFLYPFDDKHIFEDKSMSAGANTLTGFDRKDRLEIDACIRCGRCHRYCPAVISEKKLSPLTIMEKLKKLSDRNRLSDRFIPDTFSFEEINSCYSCGACSELCPVLANPMKKIQSIRKYQTAMNGNVLPEVAEVFNNIDFYGNVSGSYDRDMKYSTEIKVPLISEVQRADYILFLGCRGKSDERTISIINKFHQLTKKAGITTAIIGEEEICCGDLLLQQGNEFLFRETALKNLSSFEKYRIKNIITFCPHGYNSLKKEYSKVLKDKFSTYDYSVFHYTEILNQILNRNLLKINKPFIKNITYHDPCFLGRYNSGYKDPRSIISRISDGIFFEMKAVRNKSGCCGGGAGKFIEKERSGTRPNDIILREAYNTGAAVLASSCPICLEQFSDSCKTINDINIEVKDIIELVYECVE
ncbi:MAG: (Fe-S)-binding protein [Spirochaetes bacterium]|nr:(Fe-S)-binding protein [Spirochaetota bacterium]